MPTSDVLESELFFFSANLPARAETEGGEAGGVHMTRHLFVVANKIIIYYYYYHLYSTGALHHVRPVVICRLGRFAKCKPYPCRLDLRLF